METMTPREIVQELDKHIIGQKEAKRAVAIALRNRRRRQMVSDEELRAEIKPKNILMIGPTGVGKTEISRRLAKLANAPFIKVEATKFTEVGYVGRDVDSIIRELAEIAVKQMHEHEMEKVAHVAEEAAEERVLDALLSPPPGSTNAATQDSHARQVFRKKLREGDLDDHEIEIDVVATTYDVQIMSPPGMEEMTSQLQNMFQNLGKDRPKKRKLTVKAAMKLLRDEEAAKIVNREQVIARAVDNIEQNGIVFIDEIDKVTRRSDSHVGGADVSREGVQRDLLPLIEGCAVTTKYGVIRTDHILFIASGAFQIARPSDLIPELQGRLPIRVELESLSVDDFERILTEPDSSLTEQYIALMATEGLELSFSKDGIRRLAEVAANVNERTENIGARRLYTVMEKALEKLSFEAGDNQGDKIKIDKKYIDAQLTALITDEDLSRYIL